MKKAVKHILVMILVLVFLTGCGAGKEMKQTAAETGKEHAANEAESGGKKTRINIGITDNVTTCTPLYKINYYSDGVLSNVFQHLGQYSAYNSGEFIGVLMKNWEMTDELHYDIELYDYIYDSEGHHFTANDVKYCVDRLHEAGIAQSKYVTEVEVTGDYTATLVLSSPSVGYFEDFCQNCWMFTQEAMEKSADEMATDPVGTGPYVMTSYLSGSTIELAKREDYWQKAELTPRCSEANFDQIGFTILNEATQMALALENGTIQLGFWLGESIVPDAQTLDSMITESYESSQLKAFIFNCSENSIFGGDKGKLLRQAVCYAVDNQALVASALNGIGGVPDVFGVKGTIGYNEEWEKKGYYETNVKKARELLSEAGYPDGFKCSFWGSDAAVNRNYMQVVQACCAAVGIEIELNFVSSNVNSQNQNDLTAGWDMYTVTANGGNGYLMQYFGYYADARTSKHEGCLFGVDDPQLQKLVEAASSKKWTQKDIDALYEEIVDNAYVYQYYNAFFTCSHVPELEDVYLNWREDIQPGACRPGSDWPCLVD